MPDDQIKGITLLKSAWELSDVKKTTAILDTATRDIMIITPAPSNSTKNRVAKLEAKGILSLSLHKFTSLLDEMLFALSSCLWAAGFGRFTEADTATLHSKTGLLCFENNHS